MMNCRGMGKAMKPVAFKNKGRVKTTEKSGPEGHRDDEWRFVPPRGQRKLPYEPNNIDKRQKLDRGYEAEREPVEVKKGGKVKSKVNASGNYTKPGMRKSLFESIKASATQGTKAGQWSARKAQLLAKKYKEKGGGYRG